MINRKKGFTLIELLVVVAIIGLLSSVVLASLNASRERGKDAAIQSSLFNLRSSAALQYSDTNSYDSVCASGESFGIYDSATALSGGSYTCYDSATSWASSIELNSEDGHFCVDHGGYAGIVASPLGNNDTSCN